MLRAFAGQITGLRYIQRFLLQAFFLRLELLLGIEILGDEEIEMRTGLRHLACKLILVMLYAGRAEMNLTLALIAYIY